MKRSLALIAVGLLAALFALGCTGQARSVDSCRDCIQDPSPRITEYCVWGNTSLYCANPCVFESDCALDHRCVPLTDEGTWYDDREVTRWVCMPNSFYRNKKMVYRWNDCRDVGNECPAGMECLQDIDVPTIFFCSDPCGYNSECMTSCCVAVELDDFCAPALYCR
jgi:hypothetical protein